MFPARFSSPDILSSPTRLTSEAPLPLASVPSSAGTVVSYAPADVDVESGPQAPSDRIRSDYHHRRWRFWTGSTPARYRRYPATPTITPLITQPIPTTLQVAPRQFAILLLYPRRPHSLSPPSRPRPTNPLVALSLSSPHYHHRRRPRTLHFCSDLDLTGNHASARPRRSLERGGSWRMGGRIPIAEG